MTRLMLTIIMLGLFAVVITWLFLRRTNPVGRNALAYGVGFLVSATTSIAMFLAMRAVLPAPVLDADGIIGSGLLCAVLGPTLGTLAGKRVRPRLQGRR